MRQLFAVAPEQDRLGNAAPLDGLGLVVRTPVQHGLAGLTRWVGSGRHAKRGFAPGDPALENHVETQRHR